MMPINRQMLWGVFQVFMLGLFIVLIDCSLPDDGFEPFSRYFIAPFCFIVSGWGYYRAWSFEGRYDQWQRLNRLTNPALPEPRGDLTVASLDTSEQSNAAEQYTHIHIAGTLSMGHFSDLVQAEMEKNKLRIEICKLREELHDCTRNHMLREELRQGYPYKETSNAIRRYRDF